MDRMTIRNKGIMCGMSFSDFNKMGINGSISDDRNPNFIFNTVSTYLLKQIKNGNVNINTLVEIELSLRGVK